MSILNNQTVALTHHSFEKNLMINQDKTSNV